MDHKYIEETEILLKCKKYQSDLTCLYFNKKTKYLKSKISYYFRAFKYGPKCDEIIRNIYEGVTYYIFIDKYKVGQITSDFRLKNRVHKDYFDYNNFSDFIQHFSSVIGPITNPRDVTICNFNEDENFFTYFKYISDYFFNGNKNRDEVLEEGLTDLFDDLYGSYLKLYNVYERQCNEKRLQIFGSK